MRWYGAIFLLGVLGALIGGLGQTISWTIEEDRAQHGKGRFKRVMGLLAVIGLALLLIVGVAALFLLDEIYHWFYFWR